MDCTPRPTALAWYARSQVASAPLEIAEAHSRPSKDPDRDGRKVPTLGSAPLRVNTAAVQSGQVWGF